MIRVLLFFQTLAYAAVAFVFGFIGVVEVQRYKSIQANLKDEHEAALSIAKQASGVLDKVSTVAGSLNDILLTVNRPCGAGHPCGTLENISKAVVKIQDIAVASQQSVDQSAAVLKQTQATLSGIGSDVHDEMGRLEKTTDAGTEALGKLSQTLDAAKKTIAGLQPVEQQVTALIEEVKPAAAQLPAITKSMASMTDSGAKILADGADETHKLVHPDKKKLGFWGGLNAGLMYGRKLLPPLF